MIELSEPHQSNPDKHWAHDPYNFSGNKTEWEDWWKICGRNGGPIWYKNSCLECQLLNLRYYIYKLKSGGGN